MTNKSSLTVYFTGESELYLRPHLLLWWKPVLAWSGFIIVLLFTTFCINVILRKQWWPLYPIGYAISGTWAVNFFWFSVFVSYFIKLAILRFGGVRTFRRAAPFFLGLVLGEFLVGSVWGLLGIFLQKPMYRFIW